MECPPLRSWHIQRKDYFCICKAGMTAVIPALLFHGWAVEESGIEADSFSRLRRQLPQGGSLWRYSQVFGTSVGNGFIRSAGKMHLSGNGRNA